MNKAFKRIVVTGGPCAGKSTGMVKLAESLSAAGFTPIIVPEAATAVIGTGLIPGRTIDRFTFQKTLIAWSLAQEDTIRQVVRGMAHSDKVVLIYDRGIMDGSAYVSDLEWGKLMDEFGANVSMWRDGRYDAVMHLQTAAIGAEEFYTLANNTARSETPEQARELDGKTLRAWVGHPHLRVIENNGSTFEQKMQRLVTEVMHFLGVPVPLEIEKKFLVEFEPRMWPAEIPLNAVEIEQVYLMNTNPDEEIRIRKRGQGGFCTYYRTVKRQVHPGVRVETELQIDAREYKHDLRFQKPGTRIIRKKRICFVWEGQYLEFDVFTDPSNLCILEIELTTEQDKACTPPWMHIVRDVTDDPTYSNARLAATQ